jgi:hypothetical protein
MKWYVSTCKQQRQPRKPGGVRRAGWMELGLVYVKFKTKFKITCHIKSYIHVQ